VLHGHRTYPGAIGYIPAVLQQTVDTSATQQ
jgi:hypothetical protein